MRTRSLAPLGLLVAYAIAFGATALGVSVVAFDDHPGQLYRVWHVVTHGFAPWRWDDGWWTGYPELQFYPPACAYVAALLHRASLGSMSVGAAYQAVVWLAWISPGVTTWALLARVLGSGWLALPFAFVGLTLSAGLASGVEGGVHGGMIAARLGWALLPLLALSLVREDDERASWPRVLPAALIALVVITHPAHAPTAIALLALDASVRRGDRPRRLVVALATLALAAALTAFWTMPLAMRLAETRALAWGRLTIRDTLEAILREPLLGVLTLLALAAVSVANTAAERTLAWLPWIMAGLVALDVAVLEPLGVRWLPANRVVDGAWLTAVLAAGVTTRRIFDRALPVRLAGAAASLGAIAVSIALSLPGATLTLWPRAREWPTLAGVTRGLRLDDLWATVRPLPAGRVLFVRSGVPLVYGAAWWRPHTHVTALAPIASGRAIVNGTFTHPSPVAALVYRGDAGRRAITALVETLDGRTLFGRPLAALDAATLNRYLDTLGVAAIVGLEDDTPSLTALAADAALARVPAPAPFVVWARTTAADLPEPVAPDRWRARLHGAPGAWASARVAYYPLWSARDGDARLPTRRGSAGDLEVQLARADATVDLVYGPGAPEWAGAFVSVGAVLVCAAGWSSDQRVVRAWFRRAGRS